MIHSRYLREPIRNHGTEELQVSHPRYRYRGQECRTRLEVEYVHESSSVKGLEKELEMGHASPDSSEAWICESSREHGQNHE